MNKKTMRRVYGFLGFLILGGMAYLFMLAREAGDRWPLEGTSGSLVERIAQRRAAIDRLRALEAQIPERRKRLEAITVEYDLAARVLPRESGPDQLIAAIRTKAQQSGVTPTSLRPSIVRASGRDAVQTFETWRFSLAVTGSYDQIGAFINRMEEFDSAEAERVGSEKRFFEVRDISIRAQDNGLANLGGGAAADPVRHSCSLVMQTYRYTGE